MPRISKDGDSILQNKRKNEIRRKRILILVDRFFSTCSRKAKGNYGRGARETMMRRLAVLKRDLYEAGNRGWVNNNREGSSVVRERRDGEVQIF